MPRAVPPSPVVLGTESYSANLLAVHWAWVGGFAAENPAGYWNSVLKEEPKKPCAYCVWVRPLVPAPTVVSTQENRLPLQPEGFSKEACSRLQLSCCHIW